MIRKFLAYGIAVLLSAVLTLAAILALVEVTINAISIASLPLRILAVLADVVVGMFLLVGCMYLTTRLAVVILGVGNEEFSPIPTPHSEEIPPRN